MRTEDIKDIQECLAVRERQIAAVHRISAALVSRGDLDALLREALTNSLATVDADAGSILLYDSDRERLVFRWVVGKMELIGREIDPVTDLNGKSATAYRTGKSILTTDVRRDGHNLTFDVVTGYHTENMLTIPLMIGGGESIGVLQALNKRHGQFDAGDQELLEIIGGLAATAITNARLAEEAQLAAVARAVGDLGHDIKNALTPIESMIDTTVMAFIAPMFEDLDRLKQEWSGSHADMVSQLEECTQPLREWYPEVQDSVKDGCADIREMVSAIADYIKGVQSTNIEMNDLNEVIQERLRRLAVLARTRRVVITLEGMAGLPLIPFDRRLIGRAMFNLVNNALGAMSDAVRQKKIALREFHIHLCAHYVPDGEFPDGAYCEIEVKDDGPGIPNHVMKTLFTPHTISTTPGGTGIGTRFVKSVADAHRGLVGVESKPGDGARFWIRLPLNVHITLS